MMHDADALYERILVLRARIDDADAFEELIRRYQARIRYFVRKLLRREKDLEDVLQDVWLDVVRSLRKLRSPDAFRPWLYRIARDRVYRFLRRRPTPSQPLDEDHLAIEEEQDSFDVEDAERIHRALDLLSPEHSEVLMLRFLQAMTYQEMAEVTSLNLGTVRSRLYYAKNALRDILTKEQIHE